MQHTPLRSLTDRPESWIALSDRGLLDPTLEPQGLLKSGLFVLEFALPLQGAALLLDHQAYDGWPRTFAIFHDLAAGLVILHRQGKSVARHVLPGPLPQGSGMAGETGRLLFQFNAPARIWSLTLEIIGHSKNATPQRAFSHGTNPLPLQVADLHAVCTQNRPDSPVLWFGLTCGSAPPLATPWIGLRTPIETSLGTIPASHLKPGDILHTLDHGPRTLRTCHRITHPACGSFAPVLLRAPYFGLQQDLLVSANQLVAFSGAETEYLFAEETVLIPAAALVDGRTVLLDHRRAVTDSISLDLGGPALIAANGCILAVDEDAFGNSNHRRLQTYEVTTLMSLLGRTPRRAA